MKINVLRKWLLNNLDVFVQVSRRNLPFPVMGYTHIEADADTGIVRMSCNNSESFISTEIRANVMESGEQMVETHTLRSICQRLQSPQVTLTTPKRYMLSIQSGNVILALGTEITASEIESLESFLPLRALPSPSSRQRYDKQLHKTQDEWRASFEIPVAALVRALQEVQSLKAYNVVGNDAFSILSLIHFKDNVALMATGGTYLMVRGLRATKIKASTPAIANTYIPYSLASALLAWARSLTSEFLSCEVTTQQIRFSSEGAVFRGLLHAEVKDYPKIAPFIQAMSDDQSFDISYKQWVQFFTITRITRDIADPMIRVRWGEQRIEQVITGEDAEISAKITLPYDSLATGTLTFLGTLMEQGTTACGPSGNGTLTVALIRGGTAIAIRSHGPNPADYGIFIQGVVAVVPHQERKIERFPAEIERACG